MPFHVYILQSDSDGTLYVGQTSDIEDRLLRHNQGRAKFTKSKRPWRVVYSESFSTRSEAVGRERELKALHRKDLLLKLIGSAGENVPTDL
ncbi:MAG TPA: GIY-YIG nuclease family protein [Nitrospirota bacterium]